MVPASFDESNQVLSRPGNMTDDECTALSVLQARDTSGRPVVISCWKVTREELEEIRRTGRVWLIVPGDIMPPVALSGTRPFVES